MSSNVRIEKVTIAKYRNHIGTEFAFDPISVGNSICGNNGLGKTNVLNAIMWVLTGADMMNICDNKLNVPNSLEPTEKVVIDATVKFNVATIRRYATREVEKITEHLQIDGVESKSLKDGEVEISRVLGTLQLEIAIGKVKGFDTLRFLVNSQYLQEIDKSTLRAVVMKLLENKVNYEVIYDETVDSKTTEQLTKYTDGYAGKSPTIISDKLDLFGKTLDKEISYNEIVAKWLKENAPQMVKELEIVNSKLADLRKTRLELDTLSVKIDNFATKVKKAYNQVAQDEFGVPLVLLEKAQGDDKWKNTCYISNNGINFYGSSTSERKVLTCKLLEGILNHYDITNKLPLLVDEVESIDSGSLFELQGIKNHSQIIAARVMADRENTIKVGRL